MPEPSVLTELRGAAAFITLNRLDQCERLDHLRAVVLRGAGRAFCAGADLKYLKQAIGDDQQGMAGFLERLLALFDRLERFPLPVIAAVNGLALAGGLEIVLCCDLVIAGQSARLGDAHANYGLLPGGGGSVRLPRKIGPTRAKHLLFTGAFVPAADLVAAGLVNEVVPDEELDEAVDRLVAAMAQKSPLGLRRMKALVDDGLEQPRETALRHEILALQVHARSHDMQEGLAAFEQKRKPNFVGR
jgi:enoyl-CoA hydratase/carnithine racemase